MLNATKLEFLFLLLAHLLCIFVTCEDFFEQSCMMNSVDNENSVYELNSQMHSLFSLEVTVSDVKYLGHHAWTFLIDI